MKQKAVFLDKDGTLIHDLPYNVDPEKIELYPETPTALRLLADAGYLLVVVTNQSGVARGYFEEEALAGVEQQLKNLLPDLPISGFYYCPHHPQGTRMAYARACDCRKPQPGMLLRAARELNIDLASSWMLGDILNDVEAGHRAGCRSVLIDRGNETEYLPGEFRTPEAVCPDLLAAARFILQAD